MFLISLFNPSLARSYFLSHLVVHLIVWVYHASTMLGIPSESIACKESYVCERKEFDNFIHSFIESWKGLLLSLCVVNWCVVNQGSTVHCVITFMVNGQNFRFWRVGWALALSALVVRIIRVLFGSIWEYRPHSVRSTMCHVTQTSKTRVRKKKLGIVFHGTASLQLLRCVLR